MKYSKDTNKNCEGKKYVQEGSNSSSVVQEAKDLCTNNDDCSILYDAGCDGFGPFQICDKHSVLENSPSSCIYTKKGNSYILD